jgi:hypothetical protein
VSSKAKSENEKQTLIELACTSWQAAVMSERVLGSSFISSRREVGQPIQRPATSMASVR